MNLLEQVINPMYKKGNRSRLPVIQFTVEKDKKHKRIMRISFEDLHRFP